MKKNILFFLFLSAFGQLIQASDYKLSSPDGKIKALIRAADNVALNIEYKGVAYLQIPQIQLQLEKKTLGAHVKIEGVQSRTVNSGLFPLYGINKRLQEKYNELHLKCKGNYSIIFRAYNEGVAWRFVTRLGKSIVVKDEKVDYRFADNYKVYFHPSLSESDYRVQRVSSGCLSVADPTSTTYRDNPSHPTRAAKCRHRLQA